MDLDVNVRVFAVSVVLGDEDSRRVEPLCGEGGAGHGCWKSIDRQLSNNPMHRQEGLAVAHLIVIVKCLLKRIQPRPLAPLLSPPSPNT